MQLATTRRRFIAGLGAAIVTAAAPVTALHTPARTLPHLTIRIPQEPLLTGKYLSACVKDLFQQIAALAPISDAEAAILAANIDDELWQIRPAFMRIIVKTPVDRIISGDFTISEQEFGDVLIS